MTVTSCANGSTLSAQKDYRNGSYKLNGGVVDPIPEDAPLFVRQYHDYYKTARGYHRRSPNSNGGITETSCLSFINMPILSYIGEIRSPVLLVHGEKAHSRYFSEDAYKRLTGDNKELLIVPRSQPCRSVRQSGCDTVRQDRRIFPEIFNG